MQKNRHLSSFQTILLGFLTVIGAGTLLLILPISSKDGNFTPFVDALFTATSSTCVTGLIAFDTATHWTLFGQMVILLLIQTGGLGVVTVLLAFSIFTGRKIGFFERNTMQESISAPQVGGIVRLTGFILRFSFTVELIGAVLMAPVFCKDFGALKGIWYSVFHSVSAFCNAGFDLMGASEPLSSLVSYVGHPVINLVIMLLIVIGGLGFLTYHDIRTNKWRFSRYRMQSKVIFTVTAILIVLPAIFFYFFEFTGAKWSELSAGNRIFASLFQSVTTRTAGFNTVDLTKLGAPAIAIIIFLMLVGGSPGSTAGGMKTTTLAILFAAAASVFRGKNEAVLYKRSIAAETLRKASSLLTMYLTLFLSSGIIISFIENLPLGACLFETASAIGTVGLSLGITGGLSAVSKLILAFLMFFGRVGGLTLIFAALTPKAAHSKYPEEKITVG